MELDKRTIIAVLLIGLVLMFMNTDFYKEHFLPPVPEPAPETIAQPETSEAEIVQPAGESTPQFSTPEVVEPEKRLVAAAIDTNDAEEQEISVETNLYRGVLSSRGATVKRWFLKDYPGPDGSPVQLVGMAGRGNLGLLLPTRDDTLDTSPLAFSYDKSEIVLGQKDDKADLTMTADLGAGRMLRKTYTFYQNSYSIDLKVELVNLAGFIDGISYLLKWESGMNSTETAFKADMESAKGYVYFDEAEEFSISDEPEAELFDVTTAWVAIRTKYFASAVIPMSGKGKGVRFSGTPVDIGLDVPLKRYDYALSMQFEQRNNVTDDFTVYLGPLDYDIVISYNVGLEDMMDFGWALFKPFGKFVLWSFTLLHEVIPNYGFVIIIFSILIKLLLFPLTKKSYQSMKQMQSMQPLMQELNEKYKDNPQKKQQATMEMYKEYGVNPLGGCIPMVLQMPLLIALFNVFRSTIELRGASFIWWITDLSQPDTIAVLPFTAPLYGNTVNILPLFMGITMFIQQKISMKDPKQKAMVYFMPLFMTLLFNSFPSGLNLYYALFNLLSIAQETLVPYKIKTPEEMKGERKAKQKTKRRRTKHDYRGRR